jgi:hypothetical protein
MQWYYANAGEQLGPIEDLAFHDMVRTGAITPDTPVWREGMPNWMPYGQISGRKPTPPDAKKKLVLVRDAAHDSSTSPPAAPGADHAEAPAPVGRGRHHAATFSNGLTEILYRAKGWMRLLGILSIISGALQALSIAGLIIAWLPIWIGVLLTSAASQIAIAHEQSDEVAFANALEKLRKYFKIMGVLAVLSIVFMVVGGILLSTVFAGLARQFAP